MRTLLIALSGALVGCGPAVDAEPPRLEVTVAGCRAIIGDICETPPGGSLTIVVDHDDATEVRLRWADAERSVAGSTTVAVDAPGELRIEATRGAGSTTWAMEVREPGPDPLVEAHRAFGEGDWAASRAAAAPLLDAEDPGVRGRAHRLLGRLATREGEDELAAEHLLAAFDALHAGGRTLEATMAATGLCVAWIERGESLGRARTLLERADRTAGVALEARLMVDYAAGRLERRVGNLRGAWERLGHAMEHAMAGDMGAYRDGVGVALADVAQRSGRHAEALREYADAIDRAEARGDAGGCTLPAARNDLGWALLELQALGIDARTVAPPGLAARGLRPADWFTQARDGLPATCDAFSERYNLTLNLALAAELEGDDPSVRRWLDEARRIRPASVSHAQEATAERLEGELRLSQGDPAGALESFQRMEAVALRSGSLRQRWQALHGVALALEAGGDPSGAIRQLEAVGELVRAHALQVPIDLGRDAFLSQREHQAADHLRLLLAEGRVREGFGVVRALRSEFLSSLGIATRLEGLGSDERLRWDAAVEQYELARRQVAALVDAERDAPRSERPALHAERQNAERAARAALDDGLGRAVQAAVARPPAPGELWLTWFPVEGRWHGIAATAGGIETASWDHQPADIEALAPFEDGIGAARRVLLLPWGPLRQLDLHATPVGGRPLVERVPTAYVLDVAASSPRSGATRALLVADTRGDLPSARQEAQVASAALAAAAVATESLEGEAATRAAVVSGLSRASFLHFAGHGEFGQGVWDGELLLAGRDVLPVADILTLAEVPDRVLLTGCETARTRSTALENLGPAQAFVVAGSGAAVASVRTVDDALAAAFAAALYEADFVDGDPLEAFSKAFGAVRAANPTSDVASFRLISP